jgi:phosphoglucomutase
MDNETIIKKAQEYLALEKNSEFRKQIQQLLEKNDISELQDRFSRELAFGTGGIRGVIAGGYNRLNSFIIRKTTQGMANYIKRTAATKGAAVVIAYDSRHFSDLFSLEAAEVLCGNGITTYLFSSLRPTPELSFAVRHLKATAGIVVTASHNPPEYNGYKVYWSDGGQIVAPQDMDIVDEVRKVDGRAIVSLEKEAAVKQGLLKIIDKEVDVPFIDMVKRLSLRPDLVREKGAGLKVVYTPLNGAGAMPVERALKEMGIKVIFVEEQKRPDGDFPTVSFPNPEEASAMKMSIDLAIKEKADLVMGTDPDADRLGIAVPGASGYVLITGNQLGALLLDYIVTARKEARALPANAVTIKTIVTTELQRLIAQDHRIGCIDVLTGFKYIGQKIHEFESGKTDGTFIFGTEESYGFLVGTDVRDKDAVSAATMTAEMTAYHCSRGSSVMGRLEELYEKHGYFEEALHSRYFKGEKGMQIMADLTAGLRKNPPKTIAGQRVSLIKDYQARRSFSPDRPADAAAIDLPVSDVLQFLCADQSIISVRPSGTEPKIKFYLSCRCRPGMPLSEARRETAGKIALIKEEINAIIKEAAHE